MEKDAESFLFDLLSTPSPTGFEAPGQRKWAAYTRGFADEVESDAYGNVWATVRGTNAKAPTLMLEAHADEIGYIVRHVTDDGFLRIDRIGVTRRTEERDAFRYRVGRARHGQLADVLDPSLEYDAWREMSACTKPTVEVLFMRADYDGEVAADDPRVMRVEVDLGPDAIGKRIFLRAVGTHRVEVSTAVAGESPGPEDQRFAVELQTGMAFPV